MKTAFLLSAFSLIAIFHATAEPIDLPTALRLAGAQNLDVRFARERLEEARASYQGTLYQFFPWLAPSIGYRAHTGLAQNTDGTIISPDKQLVSYGPALVAQIDLGDAIYKRLASRQLVNAAQAAAETQRQDSMMLAALAYFDLVKSQAVSAVSNDAMRVANDYARQLDNTVATGIALKADALRARVQVDKAELSVRQALEQQRIAAARLSQILHLDPAVELAARDADLAPLHLVSSKAKLDSLISYAQARPELAQSKAFTAAARAQLDGAKYGPLIPTLSASVSVGGLAGGPNGGPSRSGDSEDYGIALSWRIGPGGLFDRSRKNAAESRLFQAELQHEKTAEEISRQVVEAYTRLSSLSDQLNTVTRAVENAREALRLATGRTELGVAAVLDQINGQQDLAQIRLAYVATAAEFNKAQYWLQRATGGWVEGANDETASPKTPSRGSGKK